MLQDYKRIKLKENLFEILSNTSVFCLCYLEALHVIIRFCVENPRVMLSVYFYDDEHGIDTQTIFV